MALRDVATGGDELESLRVLRDALAGQIDVCDSPRDFAALSLRFMDLLERISVLEKAKPAVKGTVLDEFSQRRAGKAAAKGPARSARGK